VSFSCGHIYIICRYNIRFNIRQHQQVPSVVMYFLLAYRKKYNNRAVKKTLSIPEWLNEAASKAGINFSQTLQDALKEKLDA
jgi:hypothetical protein